MTKDAIYQSNQIVKDQISLRLEPPKRRFVQILGSHILLIASRSVNRNLQFPRRFLELSSAACVAVSN